MLLYSRQWSKSYIYKNLYTFFFENYDNLNFHLPGKYDSLKYVLSMINRFSLNLKQTIQYLVNKKIVSIKCIAVNRYYLNRILILICFVEYKLQFIIMINI